MDNDKKPGMKTRAIHGGIHWKDTYPHPVNPPIYASSTFAFPDLDYGARVFSGEEPDGYTYGRLANPTVRDVEMRLAAVEGGEEALLLASGMAAVSTLVFGLLKKGDHMVADHTLYGGTLSLLSEVVGDHGIDLTFVDGTKIDEVKAAIRPETKLIYFETPTNPTLRVIDMEPIVKIAKEHEILTCVDSTFMSPILMRPFEWGVDIVLHSTTKYLNGQSDIIGGVLISRKELVDIFRLAAVHYGGILGPFEAYLLGRGLRTLKLRVLESVKNAEQVVEYLVKQPLVRQVYYPGLPDHPQHDIAKKQQDGFGGLLGIELAVDFEKTKLFVNSLNLFARAVSLGGVESLVSHPASTTHAIVDPELRAEGGITDTYIRFAIGIEDIEDIIADLDQAFKIVQNSM